MQKAAVILFLFLASIISAYSQVKVNHQVYNSYFQSVEDLISAVQGENPDIKNLQLKLNGLKSSHLSKLPEFKGNLARMQKKLDQLRNKKQSKISRKTESHLMTEKFPESETKDDEIINDQPGEDSVAVFNHAEETVKSADSLSYLERQLRNIIAMHDKGTKDTGLEIDNLILDETITKIGKDFYDVFFRNWMQNGESKNSTIVVEEKPLPSVGSKISIKVNEYYVFQKVLQPRYDVINEAALASINTVTNFLANYHEIQSNLQGEDLQGTGIY